MPTQRIPTVALHENDNVFVSLKDLGAGDSIGVDDVRAQSPVPAGHKVARFRIEVGAPVLKYGQVIGFATEPIAPGTHVHSHNMGIRGDAGDSGRGADAAGNECEPPGHDTGQMTFQGIVRTDGRVATRNYIGVLSTVTCSAGVARFIARAFPEDVLAEYPNVDGVVAFDHGTGCGMADKGEGFDILQRTMAGYARQPNLGGVLVVGLGCEVNLVDCFLENMNLRQTPFLRTLNIQDTGGTSETVRAGVAAIRSMLPDVDNVSRKPVSTGHVVLGLECGGSDAFSGISANPALGRAVDLLVQNGGTAILGETPEIYGAEHLLVQRSASPEVGEQLMARVRWWEEYTARNGAEINNNPTPGNKAGGITTIFEKSLGAVAKAGCGGLEAVYRYAEPVTRRGLVFMDTPGLDFVSVTGMIAGGANVICFTTGRGTVCGFKPVPTLKLASNSDMYHRLEADMDVNCGRIVDGDADIQTMGEEIFRQILATASGRKTKSEQLGFGDAEFVPWHIGAVL